MRNTGRWVAIKHLDHLQIQITGMWITNSKKVNVKFTLKHAMKAKGRVQVKLYSYF
jgi:hypothetical protein